MDPVTQALYIGLFLGSAMTLLFGWLIRHKPRPKRVVSNFAEHVRIVRKKGGVV